MTSAASGTRQAKHGQGRLLEKVFELWDRAGIVYCVTHGYLTYPDSIPSDVDVLLAPDVSAMALANLLHDHREWLGADVISLRGGCFKLCGWDEAAHEPFLLIVDCQWDTGGVNVQGVLTAPLVLASRRRCKQFWVPAPAHEFGMYLIRKIQKGSLGQGQAARLTELYREDPEGCRKILGTVWSRAHSGMLDAAARSGEWAEVQSVLAALRTDLPRSRQPLLGRLRDRLSQMRRPYGLHLVFLGPDGAGKSTAVSEITRLWSGVFPAILKEGFAPGILTRMMKQDFAPNPQPHAQPLRSAPASVIRALGYWLPNATVRYALHTRTAQARGALVLNDRHFVDALVDPVRYRYGGPQWLLESIWRVAPKPDLVFVMDASPEIIRARKQEVPLEETIRQCHAYRALVSSMPNGIVIDASKDVDHVVRSVSLHIMQYVADRNASRQGKKTGPFRTAAPA